MARGWFGNSAGHSAAAKGRGSGGAVRRASKSVSSATKPKAPFVSVNRSGSKTKGIKPEEILAGTRMDQDLPADEQSPSALITRIRELEDSNRDITNAANTFALLTDRIAELERELESARSKLAGVKEVAARPLADVDSLETQLTEIEQTNAAIRMKGKNTVVAFSGKQANSQARAMAAGGKVSGVRVNRKGVGTKRSGTKVTRTF